MYIYIYIIYIYNIYLYINFGCFYFSVNVKVYKIVKLLKKHLF